MEKDLNLSKIKIDKEKLMSCKKEILSLSTKFTIEDSPSLYIFMLIQSLNMYYDFLYLTNKDPFELKFSDWLNGVE
jgi:hypothetical protein